MHRPMKKHAICGVAALVMLGACDADITVPDYANPDLRGLIDTPTPDIVRQASTGMIHGTRQDHDTYVKWGAILGREGYYLDPNESRYVRNIYQGVPNASNFTGSSYWTTPYRNVQLGYLVANALEKVDMPAAEESAIRGFARTIQSLDYLQLLNTREKMPVEVDNPLDGITTPPPIAERADAIAFISSLLDEGLADLNAASGVPGDTLPFISASGMRRYGFNTIAGMRQFNRALKARVEVYRATSGGGTASYGAALTALGQSFISTDGGLAGLAAGPYQTYSGNSGDVVNTLYDPSGKMVADSMLWTRAQARTGGRDMRVERKTVAAAAGAIIAVQGLSSNRLFTMYNSQSAPIPIVRNEELILLRAEARWFTGDKPGAMADLNYVRTTSGGLDPIAQPATDQAFVTALLYERRYSLMFEGAHSWIDWRRFGRLASTCPTGVDNDDCRGLQLTGTQRVSTSTNVVASWLPLPSNETLPRS
jgi:starch-binding outer membrane protein, SusD/RagB family